MHRRDAEEVHARQGTRGGDALNGAPAVASAVQRMQHTQELRRGDITLAEKNLGAADCLQTGNTKANKKDMHGQGHAGADVRASKGTVGCSQIGVVPYSDLTPLQFERTRTDRRCP